MDLITRFLDICFLKAGPQDLPNSTWLMKFSLVVYFVLATLSQLLEYSLSMSLAAAIAELILMMLLVAILLRLRGYSERFNQTVTAMAGTGTIISLIALPLVNLASGISPDQMTLSDNVIMVLIMSVLLWSLMVTAHIFRNALEIKAGLAVALTVIYTIALMLVVGTAMSGAAV
jgi:FtsH-binding integral membrane protein